MRYRFPTQARLSRTRDFEAVYRAGERVNVFPLRVRALRKDRTANAPDAREDGDPGSRSRLGLAVGRRVGPAWLRNRWKRAIRTAFRLHRHRLSAPYDLVVAVAWESTEEDVERVEQAFLAVVEVLQRRAQPRPGCGSREGKASPAVGGQPAASNGAGDACCAASLLSGAIALIGKGMGWALIGIVKAYQFCMSPLLPQTCRFQPTCSHYMVEAIRRKGPLIGVLKGIWRLVRCNPMCRGGYDPVQKPDHGHGAASSH